MNLLLIAFILLLITTTLSAKYPITNPTPSTNRNEVIAIIELQKLSNLYVYNGYQKISLKDFYTGYNLTYTPVIQDKSDNETAGNESVVEINGNVKNINSISFES